MDRADEIAAELSQKWRYELPEAITTALREYAAEKMREEREWCAKVADYYAANSPTARTIAAQIREGK